MWVPAVGWFGVVQGRGGDTVGDDTEGQGGELGEFHCECGKELQD